MDWDRLIINELLSEETTEIIKYIRILFKIGIKFIPKYEMIESFKISDQEIKMHLFLSL